MASRKLQLQQETFEINLAENASNGFQAEINGETHTGELLHTDDGSLVIRMNEKFVRVYGRRDGEKIYVSVQGKQFVFNLIDKDQSSFQTGAASEDAAGNEVGAPMPGKLLKIFVSAGDAVEKGQRLFIVEAMKMENEVKAARAGVVSQIHFDEGALVSVGEPILEFEDIES
ncbi:MAG: biotin/lipoyl-containing protein [Calditrichota bacterium]